MVLIAVLTLTIHRYNRLFHFMVVAGYTRPAGRCRLGQLVVIATMLIVLTACVSSEELTAEAERTIAASQKLTELDRICESIPKPEGFRMVTKRTGHNLPLVEVGYKSAMKNEEAIDFLRRRLIADGWSAEADGEGLNSKWLRFRRGDRTVTLNNFGSEMRIISLVVRLLD